MLGAGANILISDAGFDGLVIHPQLKDIEVGRIACPAKLAKPEISDFVKGFAETQLDKRSLGTTQKPDQSTLIKAGAGVDFNELIDICLQHNLSGLEEFSGIPGTVGGAVYINIHFFEFLLSQFLVSAEIIDRQTGTIQTVDTSWFNFGYDQSNLQNYQHYLISATFSLKPVTPLQAAFAQGRAHEIRRYRAHRYPKQNTCGSFFRNFHPAEVKLLINQKPMIFTAYYLDKLGVKGSLRIGDAQVSHQHANMLVNLGQATTQDLISLAREMQQLVYNEFGIIPQPECILVGFKEYPLLRLP